MIGRLRGRIVRRSPDRVVLDVGGVGYAVRVSLATFADLERTPAAEESELYVHTHVREDELALYGFSTEREQALFERLIAVSGIGPRLAQVVLSGMAVDDLVAALAAGDVPRLMKIPGVGKKTAERMVVELRDHAAEIGADLSAAPTSTADDELVDALVHLGYKKAHAEAAVAQARREAPTAPFAEHLKTSLRRLARL